MVTVPWRPLGIFPWGCMLYIIWLIHTHNGSPSLRRCMHTYAHLWWHSSQQVCLYIWSAWPLSFPCLCLRVFRTNSSPCPQVERHPRAQGVAWGVGDTGPLLGTRVEWRIRCVLWEFLGCHGLGPAAHCDPGTAPLTSSDHRLIQ